MEALARNPNVGPTSLGVMLAAAGLCVIVVVIVWAVLVG